MHLSKCSIMEKNLQVLALNLTRCINHSSHREMYHEKACKWKYTQETLVNRPTEHLKAVRWQAYSLYSLKVTSLNPMAVSLLNAASPYL